MCSNVFPGAQLIQIPGKVMITEIKKGNDETFKHSVDPDFHLESIIDDTLPGSSDELVMFRWLPPTFLRTDIRMSSSFAKVR